MNMAGSHKIVQCVETSVELDVLKGPRDPELRDFIRAQPGNLFSLEDNLSSLRLVKPANAIY